MNRRRSVVLGAVVVVSVATAGCGGGGSKSSTDAAASSIIARLSHAAASLTATHEVQPQGSPTGKIRVVNLYSANGQPGGPIDLYDNFRPTKSDTPIISNLAYGQVSDYVSPRAPGPGEPSNLWIFPAGSLQKSGAYTGSNVSNAGWTADQQLTLVLVPTDATGSFGSKELNDASSSDASADTSTAPAGDATLVTFNADDILTGAPSDYLTVDGACVPALDQSAQEPGTLGGTFAVPAGSHTFGVIGGTRGSGMTMQQCTAAAASPAATQTASTSAGGRVDVISYGGSTGALKLLVAPVE